MTKRFTSLLIDRVALVDRGANQDAHIVLWKRDTEKRDYSTAQRVAMAKRGEAIPVRNDAGEIVNGRFPIADRADLQNAVFAAGLGGGPTAGVPAEVKSHIIKRARALGASDMIPDTWKRDDVGKAGRRISTDRLKRLKAAHEAMGRVIDEAERKEEGMGDDKGAKKVDRPEGFDLDSLDDAVKDYVSKLEEALAEVPDEDAGKDDAEDLSKRDDIPEDVKKRLADVEKMAADAKAEADRLRVEKADAEWTAKVEKFGHAPVDAASFGPMLRKISEADEDAGKAIETMLAAADEQIRQGSLFAQIGKGGNGQTAAMGKIDAEARELQKADSKLTIEQARARVIEGNPALAHEAEVEAKGGVA